jgi:S-DNA-T family DNA segregation ATPase FtsK/SpoIIIE
MDFDIEAKVVEINKGPVITRYELEPAAGVKIHRITSLSDNIALAMKAQSVRIVAPVPGKGTIGFEVPNSSSSLVYLRDVLDSKEYRDPKSRLKLALGKDITGKPVIADLATMPHLLIAGATGSGKTVCVNTIITTILYNATPDEVKFIMIDPKRVELAVFNDLPHLLSPVVTDAKKVASTLDWVVGEMDSRYELFAKSGVRNIALYNEKFAKDPKGGLPYIVIIIDELADLMMVAQADVEGAITRLAQLSRAVGIHIIIATQRPSVDVITGVIKANFPARISFKVASKVDSRTVMDMNGADKLLGRGDMLFIEPGASRPVRAQCSLISDKEIERITSFIKAQRAPEYVSGILDVQKKTSFKKFDKDEVYDEAVKLILESRQASVSVLQRRLGLGYTRAARLIDMMEDEGLVGPYQGSKPRDILVNVEEYKTKNG